MRTWHKALFISIAAALAFCGLVANRKDLQPSYQGKPLEYWLTLYFDGPGRTTWAPARQQAVATEAIRHMGTNAPTLLVEWATYADTPRGRMFEKLPDRVTMLRPVQQLFFSDRKMRRSLQASKALMCLGPDASPAFPQLRRLLNETNTSAGFVRAMWILAGIGEPAAPVLANEAANKGNPNRLRIMWRIAGVGTNATSAIPILTSLFDDPDPAIRRSAERTLQRITNVTINSFE